MKKDCSNYIEKEKAIYIKNKIYCHEHNFTEKDNAFFHKDIKEENLTYENDNNQFLKPISDDSYDAMLDF